ncbi:MAG: uroporphyrinogen-III C-methyltransferase [Candidatus Omnitrophica bacterium]|nr:uroporphyrinogen-III C-methyltransferase [Candidatus Omnitrophota bacterium]
MKKGKVFLAGAGPGEPDLITVKGLEALKQADVIVYDRLVDKRVLQYANPASELVCADKLDRVRHSDGFSKRQNLINKLLVDRAQKGKNVMRLKNGDPFVFGRATEEIRGLIKKGIEFSVIPGVTAAQAAACYSGIPLTSKGFASSVAFVTGHEDPKKKKSSINWDELAKGGTIVLYMAVGSISRIADTLISKGKNKNTSVAVISNVSKINQRTVTGRLKYIGAIVKKENIKAPAIIIIGEVVRKEKEFGWFKKSRKILFTGLSNHRPYEKGLIFHLPLIEIKPLKDYTKLDELIRKLKAFDWIVFTSRYAALYFFERLFKLRLDTRKMGGIKVAAIGNSTAEKLKEFGVFPDLVPKDESSKGLLAELKKINLIKKNILLPRSDIADKGLTEGLKKEGATIFPCVAYKNTIPDNLPDLDITNFDEIMFTSPSTVRSFKKRYKKVPKAVKIRCIGRVTLKEAKRCGLLN